jgi:hypothetical protein
MTVHVGELTLEFQSDLTEGVGISSSLRAADTGAALDGWIQPLIDIGDPETGAHPLRSFPDIHDCNLGYALSGNQWFYNRILVEPTIIRAGSVTSDKIYTVSVWNGYLVDQELSEIVETRTAGLTLVDDTTPTIYAPLEGRDLTLTVAAKGPSSINAVYEFVFTAHGSERLFVSGERLVLFPLRHNWQYPWLESLQFQTQVLTSYDGSEQRIALRSEPIRSIEQRYLIADNAERQRFEALLFGWGARSWMFPIWSEVEYLTADLPAGSQSIDLDRVTLDHAAGETMVFYSDSNLYEMIEISAVVGSTVTFSQLTSVAWPKGTLTMPAKSGYLSSVTRLSRFTGASAYGIAQITLDRSGLAPAAPAAPDYTGDLVVDWPLQWRQDPTDDYERQLQELDYLTGLRAREDESEWSSELMSFETVGTSKVDSDYIRAFYYALKGRQDLAWLSTGQADLTLSVTAPSGSTTLDIVYVNYSNLCALQPARSDLAILQPSGALIRCRVLAAVVVSDTTERLLINVPLSEDCTPGGTTLSFFKPVRLEQDMLEIAWDEKSTSRIRVNWRTVRDV